MKQLIDAFNTPKIVLNVQDLVKVNAQNVLVVTHYHIIQLTSAHHVMKIARHVMEQATIIAGHAKMDFISQQTMHVYNAQKDATIAQVSTIALNAKMNIT